MVFFRFYLLLGALLVGSICQSQDVYYDSTDVKNQVKINLLPLLIFNSMEVCYERTIKPQWTFGSSVALNVRRTEPAFLELGRFSDLTFSGHRFQNFSILQQLKWYPRLTNRSVPHGFYIGGLLRYQNMQYSSNVLYEAPVSTNVNVNLNAFLSMVGVGMEVGYQHRFRENFLVDFSFLGPQRNFSTFIGTLDATVDNEFLNALSDEINNSIGFGLFSPEINLTQTVAKRFSFWGFRYAISVGYCL